MCIKLFLRKRIAAWLFTLALLFTITLIGTKSQAAQTPNELLDKIWEALQENYPMMEYAGAYDDRWYREFKEKIEGIDDLQEALPILNQLVDRLNDYHTSLNWENRSYTTTPGFRLGWVEERVAILECDRSLPVKRGDIVKTIDGKSAADLFKQTVPQAKGATKYARARTALGEIVSGSAGSSVKLIVENADGEEYEATLERTGWSPPRIDKVLYSRPLDDQTGYIKVAAWGDFEPDDFDKHLERVKDLPFLIIDIRENGGGSDGLAEQVIGRFIDKPVVCSINFQREAGTDTFKKWMATASPRGSWQYQGAVAVLTNEGCCSATEHFASGMYEAGALLVGTPTSGACGWSKTHDLGDGVTLRCSLTFPLHGKMPSPLHGIEPHVLVLPTLKDVRKGYDSVLVKTLDLFKSGEYKKYLVDF